MSHFIYHVVTSLEWRVELSFRQLYTQFPRVLKTLLCACTHALSEMWACRFNLGPSTRFSQMSNYCTLKLLFMVLHIFNLYSMNVRNDIVDVMQ